MQKQRKLEVTRCSVTPPVKECQHEEPLPFIKGKNKSKYNTKRTISTLLEEVLPWVRLEMDNRDFPVRGLQFYTAHSTQMSPPSA